MQIKRISIEQKSWAIEMGDRTIPLEPIKTMVQMLLVMVLAYWAFNLGQNFGNDYVKLAAYLGTPQCDDVGNCVSYQIEKDGSSLKWVEVPLSENYINDTEHNNSWQVAQKIA